VSAKRSSDLDVACDGRADRLRLGGLRDACDPVFYGSERATDKTAAMDQKINSKLSLTDKGRRGILPAPPFLSRGAPKMTEIKAARQREIFCQTVIDIMRRAHDAYTPTEAFGSILGASFVGVCIALGHMQERPFTVAKLAAYVEMPRTTVRRKVHMLERLSLVQRRGNFYYLNEEKFNSALAMQCACDVQRLMDKAFEKMAVLDT